MHIRNVMLPLLMVLVTVTSCSSPFPSRWIGHADNAAHDPYGGWIYINLKDDKYIEGEFIAFENDSVIIAPYSKMKGIVAVSSKEIIDGEVWGYRSNATPYYNTIMALLPLATVFHGFFLVLTAPIVFISTAAVAASAHSRAYRTLEEEPWGRLRRFARYPQGLPLTIHRDSIRCKRSDELIDD